VRNDAQINFNWGDGSPAPGTIGVDQFSVRWTQTLNLPAGQYRFSVTVDDGVRLWVNNHLLIESWRDQAATTYTGDIYLAGGAIPIKMEYYENMAQAVAKLSWTTTTTPPTTPLWKGEYFNNKTLSGSPSLVRNDSQVNFDWGYGSPASGSIGVDRFSVRWTRSLNLSAGQYRFTVTADDGVRLWVNNHMLIDAWRDQAATTYVGDIHLSGGSIPIKLEYYENEQLASVRLTWTTGSTPPVPPPSSGTVIVDDTDPGFVKGGAPGGWRIVYEGYGGSLTWTYNNDWPRDYYNWARWVPHLAAGRYEVFVFIPERYTTTANARYWVWHANGSTMRAVSQSANGNRWISLGTYQFNGGSSEFVQLADATGEPRRTRLIAFDAVKWVPR
jgi:hypothetical protein